MSTRCHGMVINTRCIDVVKMAINTCLVIL